MVKRNVAGISAAPEKTGFLLSDAALVVLVRDYAASVERAGRVRGTYLSVLVAHSKRELGSARRATTEQAIEAVEKINAHFYPIILEAVVTPEIVITDDLPEEEKINRSKERTRRATFARTAKSTLLSAIKAGARLATMDPAKVSKASLQQYYAQQAREGPATPEERVKRTEERAEQLIEQLADADLATATSFVEGRLEALIEQVAEEDMAAAQRFVEELQNRLENVLAKLQPAPQPVRQMRGRRQVGELTLHPH